jgi:transcriptional regulator with XRE-family HTH domain
MHLEWDFWKRVLGAREHWEKLAKDFGVSLATVERWADGKSNPIAEMKILILNRIWHHEEMTKTSAGS